MSKAKSKKTKTRPPESLRITWDDAIDLASSVDDAIRHISAGTLLISNNPAVCNAEAPAANGLVKTIANQIKTQKEELRKVCQTIPRNPGTEVQEEDYPTYLNAYQELTDINDQVVGTIMPSFAELSEIVMQTETTKEVSK